MPQCLKFKASFEERNENTALISRASDTCNRCINIINRIVIKEAIIRNVPLIAGVLLGNCLKTKLLSAKISNVDGIPGRRKK